MLARVLLVTERHVNGVYHLMYQESQGSRGHVGEWSLRGFEPTEDWQVASHAYRSVFTISFLLESVL